MVDQIIVGTLTWFHVFSVIGWTGAALTFLISIKPSLSARAKPPTATTHRVATFTEALGDYSASSCVALTLDRDIHGSGSTILDNALNCRLFCCYISRINGFRV